MDSQNITGDRLHQRADQAASAAWALYLITNSRDFAKSAGRLACESLLQLRPWKEYVEEREKRFDALAPQQGILRKGPQPEESEAYKILIGLREDPSTILAKGSKITEMIDCEIF